MKAGYKNPYCRMISILMTVILVAMLTRVNTYAESSSYSIEVNITENVVTVFENGQPVKAMTCSSGSASPHSGTYRTSAKYRWLTLVGNVYGQYCTRITGHILFHSVPYTSYGNASSLEYWEYDKLGTSASLGCIRLSVEDAKWIYDNCALSTSVTFVTSGSLPLGKPSTYKIADAPEGFREWDPTDPDGNNPWRLGRESSVFQAEYYANRYEELKNAYGYDAKQLMVHWVTHGIPESRQASSEFDLTYYKENNADLRNRYGDDNYSYVYHYIEHGKAEGRRGYQVDPAYYRQCEAFVTRLYMTCLGREPEAEGLENWTNILAYRESSGAAVAKGFVFSREYQLKGVSDDEYVEMLYQVFLDRASDAKGKADWLEVLQIGVSREYIFRGFACSPEYTELCSSYGILRGDIELTQERDQNPALTAYINRMYREVLGRDGEETGLNDWCRAILKKQATPEQAAESILMSREFTDKDLDDEEYVKVLYRAFMGREYDQAGLDAWVNALEEGAEREAVLHQFASSPEFAGIQAAFGI